MHILDLNVTPIAIADPPVRNSSGVHEPYALRTIVELVGEGGVSGWGEITCVPGTTDELEQIRDLVVGRSALDLNRMRREISARLGNDPKVGARIFSAIEVAALDLTGQVLGVDADGNGTNDLDQTRVHNKVNEIDTTDDHGDAAGDAIAATTGSNWIDPVYDAAGNMTQGPQPHNPTVLYQTGETFRLHYAYDAWNRMTGVRWDNQGNPGTTLYTYGYDGLHRRIRRTTLATPTWYYHNESWQVVEERNSQGLPKVQYVWDVRYIDAAVLRDRNLNSDDDCTDAATGAGSNYNEGDERVYYGQDANFNVTSLVDAYDGVVVERYMYDPYGKPTVLNTVRDAYGYSTALSQWLPRTINTFENEVLYCGYRWDGGRAGHYHVRHRVYHPTLGRWTARDPIGYEGSEHLHYLYAEASPVNLRDPSGEKTYGECLDEWEWCYNGADEFLRLCLRHADDAFERLMCRTQYRAYSAACNLDFLACWGTATMYRCFATMEEAVEWLMEHPEVVVRTIVVVAGASYVVSTGGAGALILVPCAAL